MVATRGIPDDVWLALAAAQARLRGAARPPTVTADDVYAECLVAAWAAADAWRSGGPARFETYAATACRRAVARLYRVARRRGLTQVGDQRASNCGRAAQFRHPAFESFDAPTPPDHPAVWDEPGVWAEERPALAEKLTQVLDRLPPGSADLLRRRYYGGMTQGQIAETDGTRGRTAVLEMEKRARAAARAAWTRLGFDGPSTRRPREKQTTY